MMFSERFTDLFKQIREEIDKATNATELNNVMEALYDLGDKADDKLMELEGDLTDDDDWEDLDDDSHT